MSSKQNQTNTFPKLWATGLELFPFSSSHWLPEVTLRMPHWNPQCGERNLQNTFQSFMILFGMYSRRKQL
jgi:hypothetical protein